MHQILKAAVGYFVLDSILLTDLICEQLPNDYGGGGGL